MSHIRGIVVFLCCGIGLSLLRCGRKSSGVDNEVISASENATLSGEFIAILQGVYQAAYNTRGTGSLNQDHTIKCDTLRYISGDSTAINPVLFFDFLPSNCSMPDGRIRSGKISVKINGRLREAGSGIRMIPVNYMSEQLVYNCDSIVASLKSAGNATASLTCRLYHGSCSGSDISVKTFTFDLNCAIRIKSAQVTQDQLSCYGSTGGLNSSGKKFTAYASADNPVTKKRICSYIDKGSFTILPEGFRERTLDFGNGSCDALAAMVVNNNTIAIRLK